MPRRAQIFSRRISSKLARCKKPHAIWGKSLPSILDMVSATGEETTSYSSRFSTITRHIHNMSREKEEHLCNKTEGTCSALRMDVATDSDEDLRQNHWCQRLEGGAALLPTDGCCCRQIVQIKEVEREWSETRWLCWDLLKQRLTETRRPEDVLPSMMFDTVQETPKLNLSKPGYLSVLCDETQCNGIHSCLVSQRVPVAVTWKGFIQSVW